MLIPPKYTLTPKISQLLASIEASKQIIEAIDIPPEVEINIRRKSSLKSSLFSARIEGNTLTLDKVTTASSKDREKIEVFNILKALEMIRIQRQNIKISDILKLHEVIMNGLTSDLGKFREEASAIFNTAGVAVYLPPPPRNINFLMEKLLAFVNSGKEQFVPIRAALAHFTFEKIHPFLDGNGRVGRILLQLVLQRGGFGMKGLLAIEEYLDNHRSLYYQTLEENEKNVTEYIEFMMEAIDKTAEETKKIILEKKDFSPEDSLLPRRAEILNIIREHKMVSFDQIRRRFRHVNERTLRFDLKKLADAGLIKKLGITKGVYYTHG